MSGMRVIVANNIDGSVVNTTSTVGIPSDRTEVLAGSIWRHSHTLAGNTNAVLPIGIQVGSNDVRLSLKMRSHGTECQAKLYRSSSFDNSSGSAGILPIVNKNDNYQGVNTPTFTIQQSITVQVTGTLYQEMHFVGAVEEIDVILKDSTQYVLIPLAEADTSIITWNIEAKE